MAVFKIFPIADTTLYSEQNSANTGLDEILDLSKTPSLLYPSSSAVARPLIKFSTEDINDTITKYIGTSSYYQASLRLFMCDAQGIPLDYTIEAYPVHDAWDMGTGRYGEIPVNQTGATWINNTTATAWTSSAFPESVTGSFTSDNVGGGNWYIDPYTQSFSPYTEKDINIDVTDFIQAYVENAIPNNGIILKTSGSLEFDANYSYTLNFFSRDSETIYPPTLELKWDDSAYTPTTNICSSELINVSLQNNKGTFREGSVQRFRISVRDKFPVRQFTTTSMFTQNSFLPSSSYYSLVDHKTGDKVVDFDENYTKISADSTSNYFDLYMTGLEPSRYYRVLIKSKIGNQVLTFDNNYIFKVE